MKELERMYEDLGVSRAVYAYGENAHRLPDMGAG